MSVIRTTAAITSTAIVVLCSSGLATAQNAYLRWSCDALWQERNQIFKNGGYCFKKTKSINFFGNAGCQFDDENDVPLSQNQRGEIDAIRAAERAKGCVD